jgi:four helix bundle protein
MEYVESYKDLEVYKLARKLAQEVFEITKSYPKSELYALTDQFRRSSRSIGGQIAEAWGKRRYKKHFISKLTDADAEQLETQHWIETSLDCRYISFELSQHLSSECKSIGKMLNSMMEKASTFCDKVPSYM